MMCTLYVHTNIFFSLSFNNHYTYYIRVCQHEQELVCIRTESVQQEKQTEQADKVTEAEQPDEEKAVP